MPKTINDISAVSSRKEVIELIDYARGLVIKDSDLAESLETSLSMISATQYLALYYNNDTYPDHLRIQEAIESNLGQQTKEQILFYISKKYNEELTLNASIILNRLSNLIPTTDDLQNDITSLRQSLKDNYEDKNPYYKNLKDKYGIDPGLSRTASDFDILYSPSSTRYITKEFLFEYAKARRYFVSVMYTKSLAKDATINVEENFVENGLTTSRTVAFNTYKAMCRFFICNMALIECLHTKIKKPFDLDYITEDDLDQLLYSFGFSEFSSFPVIYKKRIVDILNKLITKKGTDDCFVDILKIFDYKGISIFKYHLVNKISVRNDGLSIPAILSEPKFISFDSIKYRSLAEAIKEKDFNEQSYEAGIEYDKTWYATKEEIASSGITEIQTKYFSLRSNSNMMENILSTTFFINMVREIKRTNPGKVLLEVASSKFGSKPVSLDVVIVALQSMLCDYNGIEDNIIFSESGVRSIYTFNLHDYADTRLGVPPKKKILSLKDVDNYTTIGISEISSFQKNNVLAYNEFEELAIKESKKEEMTVKVFNEIKDLYKSRFTSKLNLDIYNGFTKYSDWVKSKHSMLGKYLDEFLLSTNDVDRKDMIMSLIQILTDYTYSANIKFEKFFIDNTVDYLRRIVEVFKSYTTTLHDINIVYLWNEKLFFSYIDEWMSKAKFETKSYLNLSFKYVFNDKIKHVDYMPELLDFNNFLGKFNVTDNLSTKLKESYSAYSFYSYSFYMNISDSEVIKSNITQFSRFVFADNLYDYRCPGLSFKFSDNRTLEDRLYVTYKKGFDEIILASDKLDNSFTNISYSSKAFLSDRFVIKTLN